MTNATHSRTPPVTDPRPALDQAFETAAAVISGVRAEHLDLPTPCDQMTVSDLLGHLMMVAERIHSAAEGTDPSEWSTSEPDLDLDERAPEFRAAGRAATDAWARDQTLLERPTALPWTTLPGAGVVAIYVNELVLHTWDLTAAIGATATWNDDVLAVADEAIHSELPDAERSARWAAFAAEMPEGVTLDPPFGDAVAVSDDASTIDRLVAWNGRSPAWREVGCRATAPTSA